MSAARESLREALLDATMPWDTRSAIEAALDRLDAENERLRAALTKIEAMAPVKPLEGQEFLGGAYLPHGPVNGCARAALAGGVGDTTT